MLKWASVLYNKILIFVFYFPDIVILKFHNMSE